MRPGANTTLHMPLAGLGTGTMKKFRVTDAVAAFLQRGGRHLDTAAMYNNYAAIRAGLEASGVQDLSDLVLTWKFMPLGAEELREGLRTALEALGRKRLEIALLHWPGDISAGKLMHGKPNPACVEPLPDGLISWRRCRRESYGALLRAQREGLVVAVGVSNFSPLHLDQLEEDGHPQPAVHQLELHPIWPQDELLERHRMDNTAVVAFGCLGGAHTGAPLLRNQAFQKIAKRRGKTVAQLLLRFALQRGAAVLAGGSSDRHLEENLEIFDFDLDESEMTFMDSVDRGATHKMYGPLPEEIL